MKSNKYAEIFKWLAYCITFSVAVCVVFYVSIVNTEFSLVNEIIKTLITLYGTLLGFVLTLMAIVISLADKPLIKNMIKSGHYINLLTSSKILSLLYFTSLAIFMITLISSFYKPVFYLASIFISVLVASYSLRTAYKFFQVFKHIDPNI